MIEPESETPVRVLPDGLKNEKKMNLRGQREIARVGVLFTPVNISRNETDIARDLTSRNLKSRFHFYLGDFAEGPSVQVSTPTEVSSAPQAGAGKPTILKKIESDFRANVAAGYRYAHLSF